MSLLKKNQPIVMAPAQAFTIYKEKQKVQAQFSAWKRGLIDGHIKRFVTEGLYPFCKERGYSLIYDEKEVIEGVYEWAFAHVRIETQKGIQLFRNFKSYYPAGDSTEFEWYCHQISSSEWDEFASEWWDAEFLDDSEAGFAQREDLYILVWNLVCLASSKAHKKYLQVEAWSEHAEDEFVAHNMPMAVTSEDTAYGGDRRTL